MFQAMATRVIWWICFIAACPLPNTQALSPRRNRIDLSAPASSDERRCCPVRPLPLVVFKPCGRAFALLRADSGAYTVLAVLSHSGPCGEGAAK